MPETPLLRDHSKPCKHASDGYKKVWGDGFHIGHEYQWAPAHNAWCPGGREVTDPDILTLAADIIETNPEVGAVIAAAIGEARDG